MNLNLVLKFKLADDGEDQVRGAERITVDGRGGLMLYAAGSGKPERINLAQLQSMFILRHYAAQ